MKLFTNIFENISDHLNCHFEDDCSLRYHSLADDTASFTWRKEFSRLTYSLYNGYYMKASFNLSSAEGDLAILESDNLTESDDIKCLRFQYLIDGTDNPGSIQVKLLKKNESRDYFVANGNQGDNWFAFHVPLDHEVVYIQFIATKGNGIGDILLDNVEFTPETCSSVLNAVDYCSFDNPSLCGLTTDMMTSWKQGTPMNLHNVIKHDADFRNNGYFYFIKPSTILSGSIPDQLVFKVSATTKSALQFSLLSMGGKSTSLYVHIAGQSQQTVPIIADDSWMLTDCYELSEEFSGDIAIGIENGDKDFELLAIDNVKLVDTSNCKGPSLSCDFRTGGKCSYNVPTEHVNFEGGLTFIGPGVVRSPTVLVSMPSCFRFVYSVISVDSFDEQTELVLYRNGQKVWKIDGLLKPIESSVQITLEAGVTNLHFEGRGKGLYKLFETNVREGICQELSVFIYMFFLTSDCNAFVCGDKCLSNDRKCDKYVDCSDGADESENLCGFKFSTNFTKELSLESTGFKTSESSYLLWALENNFDLTVDGKTRIFNTPFLVARFPTPLARPAVLESFEYHLENDSCLQINYLGDVAYGEIHLIYETETEKETDVRFDIKPSTDIRHVSVPVSSGDVRVMLFIYMFEIQPNLKDIPDSSIFAVQQITMHAGTSCDEVPVECLAVNDTLCEDRRSCYNIEEKCDANDDCFDGSDEANDCDNGIVCGFEKPTICGYSDITPRRTYLDYRRGGGFLQTVWERIESSSISRPTIDHTFQKSGKGHFVTSKNFEGLADISRYVDVETIESPFQTFDDDGCITFWYYLNTTAHQPKTTSAQIFVYLQYEDEEEKSLVWFDHINRPFASWMQGGAKVYGRKSAKLIVTAKTSIPYDSFPGVVSLDDVSYSPGDCNVDKIECDAKMYQCTMDQICIPESFVCDGETDCQDGTDESFCDRPNGSYKLLDGDKSYGKLAYFYNGAWRPVCYQKSDDVIADEQNLNDVNTAFHVCRELGFIVF
ncbi:MAM and LDL-receptor class A domain-containing protein 1-like [Ruditapes philippinarum]|uniref:MAM and LDL-receptor class A domain-containing protein 1-like n=1 Tax=Ruditapes philippinarum TaxID=129788 RepID=UPI00295B5031|nr:MAM and LDL-receptor class A domain-containing protein 1-like [Ruditapes philippinarum]